MDKVVEDFLKTMPSMNFHELKEATKVLNNRLENIVAYEKNLESLEKELLKKDELRFKTLREYETNKRKLYDAEKELK